MPPNVPVPFRDYLATTRFDWSQSQKSQWFLRAAIDNYITHNALVQQATLPSTGAEQHNNYMNMVIGNNTLSVQPGWEALYSKPARLHLTEARNSDLGSRWHFLSPRHRKPSPASKLRRQSIPHPDHRFPVLRNQEKYQFRYDVSRASGDHAPRFGINFIHEPVLSGALSGTAETLLSLYQQSRTSTPPILPSFTSI